MKLRTLLTTCLLGALAASGIAFAQTPPPAKPAVSTKNAFGPKSPAEAQAVNAVIQAQTQPPDEMIKAVDALLAKYADTVYKSFALELESEAYQHKGDNAKAIVYGEQALQADPKNFDAENVLANVIAATTRPTDLDKEEKLAKAEKYAHDAIDTLEKDPKPQLMQNLNEEQWTKMKKSAESLAYQALGTVALTQKKPDEAIADFQKGIDLNPDPVLMLRAGRALMAEKKYDEAIAIDQKVMDSADAPAQIKSIAQADKVRATQSKGPAASK